MSLDPQHLRPHDRGPDRLCRHIYALRPRRHAQKLPPVRLSLCQFRGADDARVSLHAVLEVSQEPDYPRHWLALLCLCPFRALGWMDGCFSEGTRELRVWMK